MKLKFNDFGRCLLCLHNPCDCKKKQKEEEIIFPSFPCPECGGDGEECGCSFADYFNHKE